MTIRYRAQADQWVTWMLAAAGATSAAMGGLVLTAMWFVPGIVPYLATALLVLLGFWMVLLPHATYYELRDDVLLIVFPPFRVRLRYDRIVSVRRSPSVFRLGVNLAFSSDAVEVVYRPALLPSFVAAIFGTVWISPTSPDEFCREIEYRLNRSRLAERQPQGT